MPRPQQSVLQGVVGVVDRAEHAVTVGVQLPAQRRHQASERSVVPVTRQRRGGTLRCGVRNRCGNTFAHERRFCRTATVSSGEANPPTSPRGPHDTKRIRPRPRMVRHLHARCPASPTLLPPTATPSATEPLTIKIARQSPPTTGDHLT
jgi:hypothetical protein